MHSDQVPISAVVVSCNEEELLDDCLGSLRFCSEIIVVDLASTDGCREIARRHGARLLSHARVPYAAVATAFGVQHAVHDWVLRLDPDERFPPTLVDQVQPLMRDPSVGVVRVPWQFYVRDRPLTCTLWGHPSLHVAKGVLLHRRRARLRDLAHLDLETLPGFTEASVPRAGDNYVTHLWMRSFPDFLEKHLRYIRKEGETRYLLGDRYRLRPHLGRTLHALRENLFRFEGWRGGPTGIGLSFFYAWYVFMCWRSLRRYQRSLTPSVRS